MPSGIEQLTDREREVLQLLLKGHTAKSAANELSLSVHTVNDYLREARKKLGVTSSKQAARLLADAENSAPQNLASEEMGINPYPSSNHNPEPSQTKRSPRRAVLWITGGIFMIAGILALALLAGSSGGADQASTPVAATQAQDEAATKDARDWLSYIDKSQWQASWENAGSIFQSGVTAESWARQVDAVRSPLGSVVSRTVKTVNFYDELPGAPEGDYMVVQFDTNYAKAPGATETVIMADEEDSWKVIGYFIK